jgi:hypothetical protein
MHRQLDDDLRESEMEVLLNHTRHCPDCAAMFERLTRLSAELTSLPKVTPSYSLVDAIMPELLRIDKKAEQAVGSSASAAAPSDDARTIARRSQRVRRFPSWKSISGVVAAGIVAGFFLISYPPQLGTSDNDSGGIHNAAADMAKKSAQENAGVSELRATAGGDDTSDSIVDIQSGGSVKGTVDQNSAEIQENLEPDVYSFESPAGEMESNATRNQEEGGGESGGMPDMGIAAQALYPSPDGQYVASIDEYHIAISTADGSPIFKSDRKNGTHGNLVWSPDSRELTYDVSLEHGATEKYVIDITEQAVRKAE